MWAYILSWFTPTTLFVFLNLTIGTIVISHSYSKTPQHQEHQQHPSLLQRVTSFDFSHYSFQPDYHPENPTGLVRTPSLLARLKSMEFSSLYGSDPESKDLHTEQVQVQAQAHEENTKHDLVVQQSKSDYHPENPTGLVRTPSLLARLKSMDFSSLYRSDPESIGLHTEHVQAQAQDHDESTKNDRMVQRSKSDTRHEEGIPEKVIKKSASERGFEEKDGGRPRRVVEKTMSFGDDEEVDAKADDFINRFKQQLKLQRLNSLLRYKETLNRN